MMDFAVALLRLGLEGVELWLTSDQDAQAAWYDKVRGMVASMEGDRHETAGDHEARTKETEAVLEAAEHPTLVDVPPKIG